MGLYDNQAIDSQFLHGYQKTAKNSVRSCEWVLACRPPPVN